MLPAVHTVPVLHRAAGTARPAAADDFHGVLSNPSNPYRCLALDDYPNLSGPYEGESQSIDTVLSLDCHQASLEFAPPAAEVRCARQGGLREP